MPGEAGVAIGGAIGTASLLFFWALGDIILGMLTFFTRGKKIIVESAEWCSLGRFSRAQDRARGGFIMRRLFFIAIALCGFANAKADQVPKFSQFPAREYSRGPTGRLNLSDPHAYSYRTRLREGAQQGANFAGHYTVVTWG